MKKQKLNTGWSFWKAGQEMQKKSVCLPHDAMITEQRDPATPNGGATGFYPGGKYYYSMELFGEETYRDSTVLLEFEGVYMKSRVFLNGEEIGGWIYGYTNYYVDLTGRLTIGKANELLVEADNSLIPNSRWYSGSGIYRDVNLYTGSSRYILPDGIKVKTLSCNPAQIQVRVDSTAAPDDTTEIIIFDGDFEIARAVGTEAIFALPDAELWSAEHPRLYRAVVSIKSGETVLDSAQCRFGIRTLSWNSEQGFMVNGETVKLRGGCVHHDHGPLGACAFEKAERRRLEMLKSFGYNAVRYSHNPANRVFLEICDELGLYVIEETFDQWRIPQAPNDYAAYFDVEWEKDICALIRKDYSHPCVIMYCVGNEIPDTGLPHGAAICEMLTMLIRQLDDTRPTTIAVNSMLSVMAAKMAQAKDSEVADMQVGSADVNDIVALLPKIMASVTPESVEALIGACVSHVDIVGYNYGDMLYAGTHALVPERIILSSETFPSAIGRNWPMVEATPYVIGDFSWTAWDYLGEAGVGQPVYGTDKAPFSKSFPCQSAYVGAIDLTGLPEVQAYYNAILWGKYCKPYIGVRPLNHAGEAYALGMWRLTDAVHSWSWEGQEGKTAEIQIFSPGEYAELFLNGASLGRKKLEAARCEFEAPYAPGVLSVLAYDGDGNEIGRDELVSAENGTKLTVISEEPNIHADSDALAYVAVHITDKNCVLKMLSDRKVKITVTGPAVLAAVGSARPDTEERFDAGSCTTFHGRLIAILRSTGTPGTIHLTAEAEGMEPQTVEIAAI